MACCLVALASWTIYEIGSSSEILFKIQRFSFMKMHLKMFACKTPWPFCSCFTVVTHWGWVMHICISKLTTIGSDNGLLPDWHQAIIWTNTGILLIGPLGTKFSEILIEIHIFWLKDMHLKKSSVKWQPFVSASVCYVYNGLSWNTANRASSVGSEPQLGGSYSEHFPGNICYLGMLPWKRFLSEILR